MEDLRAKYINYVSLETIGYSYEGRPMKIIKIGTDQEAPKKRVKPIIWIDSAIHSQEWATIPSSLYVAYRLLLNYNMKYTPLLQHFYWHILPVFNPDGYNLSRSRTEDILWQKNRRPVTDMHGNRGMGVDLNRNFPVGWDGTSGLRQSGAFSDNFAGIAPLSEKESQVVANYLSSIAESLSSTISLHSYGGMWLHPWSHTWRWPEDLDEIKSGAKAAVNGMRFYRYKDTSAFSALRDITGTSKGWEHGFFPICFPPGGVGGTVMDWAYGTLGVIYSYTLALREIARTTYFPPEAAITVVADDAWDGIKSLAFYIKKKHDDASTSA